MDRKRRLFLNTTAGFAKQLVTVVCGFILPRFILMYYGSDINGLISSITHFLSFISLLDLGVGAVVQANLYKPLADKDNDTISKVVVSSKRFFRRLAYIFLVYIVVLVFVLPNTVNGSMNFFFTASLVVIIAISTFTQYYFGMANQLLLCADQRSYIPTTMHVGTMLLSTICSVFLIKAGASIHSVKLFTAAVYVLRPIAQNIYVKHNYSIDWGISFVGEPIKQKWNGFTQHFAAVVCENFDVAFLSIFSSLSNVSVYSVYYTVANGVTMIISTAATGLESLFGNMIAKGERDTLRGTFSVIECLIHALVTFIFSTSAVLIVPFIAVYTRGIDDADYIAPVFAAVLVAAYAVRCLRIPYFQLVKAAGHFKQTQIGALISAGLNIVVSIALYFNFGLVGIAFGTFAAMLYHTCYFVWYLRKNILNRGIGQFVKCIFVDVLCCVIIVALTHGISLGELTYISWIVMAIKVGVVSVVVTFAINAMVNKSQIAMIKPFLQK